MSPLAKQNHFFQLLRDLAPEVRTAAESDNQAAAAWVEVFTTLGEVLRITVTDPGTAEGV